MTSMQNVLQKLREIANKNEDVQRAIENTEKLSPKLDEFSPSGVRATDKKKGERASSTKKHYFVKIQKGETTSGKTVVASDGESKEGVLHRVKKDNPGASVLSFREKSVNESANPGEVFTDWKAFEAAAKARGLKLDLYADSENGPQASDAWEPTYALDAEGHPVGIFQPDPDGKQDQGHLFNTSDEFYGWMHDMESGDPDMAADPGDMDGDHATGLRDAGMGSDEDYSPGAEDIMEARTPTEKLKADIKRLRDSHTKYKDWNTSGAHTKKLKDIRGKISSKQAELKKLKEEIMELANTAQIRSELLAKKKALQDIMMSRGKVDPMVRAEVTRKMSAINAEMQKYGLAEEAQSVQEEEGDDDKAIEAHGVKGMKSAAWRKTFKNREALNKWLEKQDGNAEVHGTRKAEGVSEGFEHDDVKVILAKHHRAWERYLQGESLSGDGEMQALYDDLFQHFMPDMPYGTAKARTGDPMNWIADKLHTLGITDDMKEDNLQQNAAPEDELEVMKRFLPKGRDLGNSSTTDIKMAKDKATAAGMVKKPGMMEHNKKLLAECGSLMESMMTADGIPMSDPAASSPAMAPAMPSPVPAALSFSATAATGGEVGDMIKTLLHLSGQDTSPMSPPMDGGAPGGEVGPDAEPSLNEPMGDDPSMGEPGVDAPGGESTDGPAFHFVEKPADGDGVEEVDEEPQYANSPDEKTMGTDQQMKQGDDLNAPKKQFVQAQPGDNPMAMEDVSKLEEAIAKKFSDYLKEEEKCSAGPRGLKKHKFVNGKCDCGATQKSMDESKKKKKNDKHVPDDVQEEGKKGKK